MLYKTRPKNGKEMITFQRTNNYIIYLNKMRIGIFLWNFNVNFVIVYLCQSISSFILSIFSSSLSLPPPPLLVPILFRVRNFVQFHLVAVLPFWVPRFLLFEVTTRKSEEEKKLPPNGYDIYDFPVRKNIPDECCMRWCSVKNCLKFWRIRNGSFFSFRYAWHQPSGSEWN